MSISNKEFIDKIDEFLKKTGMSVSTFGKKAKGDPSFYTRIKNGMEVKESGKSRVLDFMQNHKECQK